MCSLSKVQPSKCKSQALCSAITFRGATMISRFWEHARSNGKRGNKVYFCNMTRVFCDERVERRSEQVTKWVWEELRREGGGIDKGIGWEKNVKASWWQWLSHLARKSRWRPRVSCTSSLFGDCCFHGLNLIIYMVSSYFAIISYFFRVPTTKTDQTQSMKSNFNFDFLEVCQRPYSCFSWNVLWSLESS